MRFMFLGIVVLVFATSVASSQDLSHADIDAIAKQPGTEVTRHQDGDTEVTVIKRGGVTIEINRKGDQAETTGVDNSGHGALLCSLNIDIALKGMAELCYPNKYQEYREDLGTAIDQIIDFTVKNNLVPITREEVEAETVAKARRRLEEAKRLDPTQLKQLCEVNDISVAAARMAETTTHEQRMKELRDMLSVPRPPVLNPCM